MWLDRNYARSIKWGGMALPFAMAVGGTALPTMPTGKGMGDYMVVSHYNVTVNYYKPCNEGDTIYSVIEEEHSVDITPPQGSYYRTFTMGVWGSFYNQKGELMGEGATIITESFRRHKDPEKRNSSGAHAWESPDWWSSPYHMYTDSEGNEKSIQADSIVIYSGLKPRMDEAEKFLGSANQVILLGDCTGKNGTIQKTIRSAYFVASQV